MQRVEAPSASPARLDASGLLTARAYIAGLTRMSVTLAGLAAGFGTLAIAAGPGQATTYAGRSAAGAALTLSAGVGLIAAGLVVRAARRPGRSGDLALLAGLCWFAPVWVAWQDGPQLIPSVAMFAAGFTFPVLVQMVLTHPAGRADSRPACALITVVYANALLSAVGLALFRDPYLDPGCLANCTVNAFLVRSLPAVAHAVEMTDRWVTAAAALAFLMFCMSRLVRASGTARQRLLPVDLPAAGFAAAVLARAIALQFTTVEDPFNNALFTIFAAESAAVTLLAAGLISGVVRGLALRRAIARVAANLDQAPQPGSLQSALAEALGDPGLEISYWLPGAQSYVDAKGIPVPEPVAVPGRPVTRLTRNGRIIGAVAHSGLVPSVESQIGPAIRLSLENERLQAELLAQLEDLRASRARIVETADSERRRLERDLHDGAQQHLLALSFNIRLAHAAAQADGDAFSESALARAGEDTNAVLGELRDLAHGIYPAVLAEAGIGPALATLADIAQLPVEICMAADGRYPGPVEAAAYFVVAEALSDAAARGAEHATVTVGHDGKRLLVSVEDNGSSQVSPMVAAADRVGALGGSLSVEPARCRAEIPCG